MFKSKHAAVGALSAAVAAICGCASNEPYPALEDARASVRAAEQDPAVIESASVELERAREALGRAEATFAEEGDDEPALLEHQTYVASRLAELAQSEAEAARLAEEIENAEAERNRVRLAARTAEARRAESRAQQLEAEQQRSEQQARAAAAAAVTTAAEAERLQRRIEELEAEQTERGLVLTLGDVLFDVDQAELKPGADATIDRLATFLEEYEERVVLIEGHTDSTGPESYNESLSQRRANAVRDALMARGIAAGRIQTRGVGESSPVATNSTVAGRQQNRRVEIVISDEEGRIREDERTAAR